MVYLSIITSSFILRKKCIKSTAKKTAKETGSKSRLKVKNISSRFDSEHFQLNQRYVSCYDVN